MTEEKKSKIQSQSIDTSAELYDQIQLSPSTGQSEPIPKTECENVISETPLDCHNMEKPQKKTEPDKISP